MRRQRRERGQKRGFRRGQRLDDRGSEFSDGRCGGAGPSAESNLATSLAVLDEGVDLAGEQIDARQQTMNATRRQCAGVRPA